MASCDYWQQISASGTDPRTLCRTKIVNCQVKGLDFGLYIMRDIYDHTQVGLVLIGMPGLEKRLSRYPQLYSRVGFVHEFRPLSSEEVHVFLQRQWREWGLSLQAESVAEMEAIAAIIRITSGNLRLLHRLLAQIERLVQINALRMITKEVMELARQQLVIGLA